MGYTAGYLAFFVAGLIGFIRLAQGHGPGPLARIDLERGAVTVAEQLLEVNGTLSLGPPRSAAGRRTVAHGTPG